eukprot:8955356-Ditylum_brightwellii.AAC.1
MGQYNKTADELSSSLEEVVASIMKEHVFHHKKIDENAVNLFNEAVKMEATRLYDAYFSHVKQHMEEVKGGNGGKRVIYQRFTPSRC